MRTGSCYCMPLAGRASAGHGEGSSSACAGPQVHPQGLRHIRADRRINEWRAPGRRAISRTATNARQVRWVWPGLQALQAPIRVVSAVIIKPLRTLIGHRRCQTISLLGLMGRPDGWGFVCSLPCTILQASVFFWPNSCTAYPGFSHKPFSWRLTGAGGRW